MMSFIYILGLALALAYWGTETLEVFLKRRARKRFQDPGLVVDQGNLVDSAFRPIFIRFAVLFRRIKLPDHRLKLRARLAQANQGQKYSEEVFWAFQFFMCFFFVGVYYFVSFYLQFLDFSDGPKIIYVLVAGLIGFFYPHYWLGDEIKRRAKGIIKAFPDFVSTLSLSVEAGLDYFGGIVRYIDNASKSPLSEELAKLVSEVRLGASRETALRNLSARVSLQPISNFTAVLIQATNLGTSISQVLKVQAEKLRRQRFEAAEKAGAIASQKILFPLVFFIMPAVFLLIFGPLIVRLVTGGLQSLF